MDQPHPARGQSDSDARPDQATFPWGQRAVLGYGEVRPRVTWMRVPWRGHTRVKQLQVNLDLSRIVHRGIVARASSMAVTSSRGCLVDTSQYG